MDSGTTKAVWLTAKHLLSTWFWLLFTKFPITSGVLVPLGNAAGVDFIALSTDAAAHARETYGMTWVVCSTLVLSFVWPCVMVFVFRHPLTLTVLIQDTRRSIAWLAYLLKRSGIRRLSP